MFHFVISLIVTVAIFLNVEILVEDYPPSCFGKIPNFLGSNYAAKKVTHLREFKTAQVKLLKSLLRSFSEMKERKKCELLMIF